MRIIELLSEAEREWIRAPGSAGRQGVQIRNPLYQPPVKKSGLGRNTKKISLADVWDIIENAVGQAVPDGDPIDFIAPRLRRLGYDLANPDHRKLLDLAVKKYSDSANYNEYVADMWDAYGEMNPGQTNPWR